jgi:hypothetical protein
MQSFSDGSGPSRVRGGVAGEYDPVSVLQQHIDLPVLRAVRVRAVWFAFPHHIISRPRKQAISEIFFISAPSTGFFHSAAEMKNNVRERTGAGRISKNKTDFSANSAQYVVNGR